MVDDHHIDALPRGYRIGVCEIQRTLNAGSFGITYLAQDTLLDREVAIKEYLPRNLAVRTADRSVQPRSSEASDNYSWGLQFFLDDARMLARINHLNIVRVHAYVEANGTGYIVMDYIEGETLDDRLKREGKLGGFHLTAILKALVEGLQHVHREDHLHRDITPRSILLKKDETPVLTDFGSARQAIAARSRSIAAAATPGYAPLEQYSSRGMQGPWTDIYALSAVAYRCITGNVPLDATERVQSDELPLASEVGRWGYPDGLLMAVDLGLSLTRKERPQDLKSWQHVWHKPSAKVGEWYRRSAEQGRPSARWYLGDTYAIGRWIARDDVEAVKWFRKAAEQGHILGQTHLCGMYSRGRGVAQDDVEALKWCRLAANQEDALAQCALGVMYEKGRGIAQDDAEAVKWYRRAAEQGHARAQFYLGVMYLESRGIHSTSDSNDGEDATGSHAECEQDMEEALKWFRLAADRGVTSAKWYMGHVEDSPARGNFDNALMWRREAALAGDPAAQYTLGVKYDAGIWGCAEGKFTIEDPSYLSAWDWFRMAAENAVLRRLPVRSSDSAWLFDVIDVMYAEGRWQQVDDDADGLESYWMAKERGNRLVQYELGVMYEEGRHGFPQDDHIAVEWYRRAAEQGHSGAQYALGDIYEAGRVAQQQSLFTQSRYRQAAEWYRQAAEWYRQAADQGNAEAQYSLAKMYEVGRGVEQNAALAAVWYLRAADAADEREWFRWEKAPGQEPLGKCPRCGVGQVFEGNSHYRCERPTLSDRPCRFKVAKVILSQPLEREQVAKLLAEGATDLLENFVYPQSGQPFAACLVLAGDGEVTFRLPPKGQ